MELRKGCSWRLLALGMIHLMGTACAQLCTPLSAKARANCKFGGCCDQLEGKAKEDWGDAVAVLWNRTGLPGDMKTQVAKFQPVGERLGFSDLTSHPINADMLNNDSQLAFHVHLHVYRLSAVDQKSQTFKMQFRLKWIWKDCRVVFNCKDPVQITGDDRLASNFWLPRWSIAEQEDDNRDMRSSEYKFIGNGMSIFSDTRFGTFKCKFDFANMPFDVQKCRISLTIPGKKDSQISLHWLDISSDELSNAEWKVQQGSSWSKTSSVESEPATSYSGLFTYPMLTTEFTLTRDPGYLSRNFFDQVNLFYVLSYMGLWIDAASVPARVAAGVIPALTTSNKMSALASILPPISYPTKLSRFLELNLYIIVIHFVLYGLSQWASRRLKSLAKKQAETKKSEAWAADEAFDAKAAWPADGASDKVAAVGRTITFQRFEERVVTMIDSYLELTARIVSPLVYIVAILIIFNS